MVSLNENPRFVAEDGVFAIWGATRADGQGSDVSLKGSLGNRVGGEMILCVGRWQDTNHGWTFVVDKCRSATPKTAEGIKKFLENRVHGIGPVFAQAIVDSFPVDKVFDIIDEDPTVLYDIKTKSGRTISRKQVDGVIAAWDDVRQIREIEAFLFSFDVDQWLAVKLYERYGHEVIGVLERDPYVITRMRGVGFKTADRIALSMGVPKDDPKRLEAGILYVLEEAEAQGHSYLPDNELELDVADILKVSDPQIIENACRALAREGLLTVEDTKDGQIFYRTTTYERELELAQRIRAMVAGHAAFEKLPDRPQPPEGMTAEEAKLPTDEQWGAVELAFTSRISILTGGPGTGKTQTTRALIDAIIHTTLGPDRAKARILLGAPTGKAARRMTELTGHAAQTIHRMLAWSPQEGTFLHDASNPLAADLVIIDEASMLSLDLALRVIRAIGPRTHLVLVGDADQLPPIGAGKPLDDMLGSGVIPATRLTRIFRQAAKSMIITNAHRMNNFDASRHPHEPYTSVEDARSDTGMDDMINDFFFIRRKEPETIVPTIVEVFTQRVQNLARLRGIELDPIRDVMVLAPQNPGKAGIGAINEALQDAVNPRGMRIPGPRQIRVGDRIQQQKNNYDLGVMNGETAQVESYDETDKVAVLRLDDAEQTRINVSLADLETFKVAYAMSVHKSQGSQFKCVIVVCAMTHHRMLNKPLLYTAVTRASDVCVMIGQHHALMAGLRKTSLDGRNSLLQMRIREAAMSGELF